MDHAPRATAPQALVADVAVAATSDGLSALDDPETSRRLAAKVRVISEDASGECAPLLRREPNGAVPTVAKVNGATPECRKGPVNSLRKASGDSAGVRPALHVQFRGRDDDAPGERCPSSASSSSSSSEDDSSVSLSEARPPDGGWGWVVVAASFAVNLIADGVTFSFGVIFVHFLEYFGEGKAKTAWIGSLFMAMPLLSGPIASFLTDRYGCRKVTMVGSVLACLGFVASAFVTSMEALFFTFGVLAGFGLSLCYVAAVVIVAYYFEKKRSLATGLSVCGSGIGTFIFAPLTQILLDEYGWRGTTLILAGCFLNMAVCGALMRDLPWTTTMIKAKAKDRKRSREQKRLKRYESSVDSISDSKSSNAATQAQAAAEACDELSRLAKRDTRQFSSLVDLPTYVAQAEHLPYEVLELMSNRRHVYDALLQNCPGLMIPSRSFSDSGRLHEAASRSPPPPSPLALSPGANEPLSKTEYQQWLEKTHNVAPGPGGRPKLATAFLKDLRLHRHSLTYRGAMLNINRYRLRASSCPNIYRNSMTTIAKEKVQWYAGLWDLWDLIVDVLDFSHFANPKFLLFAVSNFLLYTWYDVPYVYIADNAMEMGYTESQSSMLISSIGILNMVGEIFLGWAGDVECLNASVVYAGCMLLCGGVTALLPLVTSYSGMTAASGMFGLFIAANYSLTSIILVELITLEKFTNAYGLLLLVQGVANLIGPPLAGWMYDKTGSYDLSFYMSGLFIALSGVLLVILPIMKLVRRYRAKQANPTQAAPTNGRVDSNIEAANGDVIKSDHNKYSKVYL